MNEVDIGLNLCPGMAAVPRAKLERTVFRDSILNAKRYSAPEGVKVIISTRSRMSSACASLTQGTA
jgi:hypothetical protein